MTNRKRAFSELQEMDPPIVEPLLTSKKLKTQTDNSLKIYARIRPSITDAKCLNVEDPVLKIDLKENSISILQSEDQPGTKELGSTPKFFFTKVFNTQTTQEDIMRAIGLPVLVDLLNEGKPGLVLSYGSTIKEKLYTVLGDQEQEGILPKSIGALLDIKNKLHNGFNERATRRQSQGKNDGQDKEIEIIDDDNPSEEDNKKEDVVDLRIYFEAFEIYNEEVYDLLKEPKKDNNSGSDKREAVAIKDLSMVELMTPQQAFQVLARWKNNFERDNTVLADRSTKSHFVFRLVIKYAHKLTFSNLLGLNTGGARQYTTSSFCIVSLAAPERLQKAKGVNQQNNSGNVINVENGRNDENINNTSLQKDYKLTRVLFKYFSGNSNLHLIAHLEDQPTNFDEVMSILTYTAQIKQTKVPSTSSILRTPKLNIEKITQPLNFQETIPSPVLSLKSENMLLVAQNIPNTEDPQNFVKLPNIQEAQPLYKSQELKKTHSIPINNPPIAAVPNKKTTTTIPNRASSCTTRPQARPITQTSAKKKVMEIPQKKFMNKPSTMEKPNLIKKDLEAKQQLTEKDLKIKVLEDLLRKLEDEMLIQTLNNKIQTIDESFNNSVQNLIKSLEDTTRMGFLSYNSKPFNWNSKLKFFYNLKLRDGNDTNSTRADSPVFNFSKEPHIPQMVPVNVNYFIFQGPMGTERINSLENVFRANAEKAKENEDINHLKSNKKDGINKANENPNAINVEDNIL